MSYRRISCPKVHPAGLSQVRAARWVVANLAWLSLCILASDVFAGGINGRAGRGSNTTLGADTSAARSCGGVHFGTTHARANEPTDDTGEGSSDSQPATLVLQNAWVFDGQGRAPFRGTLVIRRGKIDRIVRHSDDLGEGGDNDFVVPTGARAIDLSGYFLTPGLIDCQSKLWLTAAAVEQTNSQAGLNVVDGIDAWQEDWREAAAQGITTVYVQPSGNSRLGGFGAVLRVIDSHDPDEIIARQEVAVQAAISITGSNSRTRYADFTKLKTAIEKAVKQAEQEESEDEEAGDDAEDSEDDEQGESDSDRSSGSSSRSSGNRSDSISPPDLTESVLARVVKKEIPLRIEVRHADTAAWALELVEEFDLPIILDGADKASRVSEDIGEQNLPVVVGPVISKAPRVESPYRGQQPYEWLGEFASSGGLWALGTFSKSARQTRLLRFEAAASVANLGVSRAAALQAVTGNAARILGMDDEIGTLAVGKRADIAVFAGHPLDPSSATRLVLNGGRVTYSNEDVRVVAADGAGAVSNDNPLPASFPSAYAIKTRRLLKGGEFAAATIVVRDGKIQEVAAAGAEVANLPVYDVGDGVVSAPLVVAHSHVGQVRDLSNDIESDNTYLRATDFFDPTTRSAQVYESAGFGDIAFAPHPGTTSPGLVGHVKLGRASPVFDPEVASLFVLAESARDDERFPASLTGQYQLLDGLLSGQVMATRMYVGAPIKRALNNRKRKIIADLKSGELKTLFEVDHAVDVRAAVELANRHELDAVLLIRSTSAAQAILDLPEDQRGQLGVVIGAATGTEFGTWFETLAQLTRQEIPVGFSGEDPQEIRLTAGLIAAANGSAPRLLSGLTSGAARLTGMDSSVGEVVAGQPADFVIWDGSPLDYAAQPLGVLRGGQFVEE